MNGAAYILVVMGIFIAKGLGFFRDMVFARTFGATELTDIYFTIFTLVNLIFTGIGTAMQTLVIKRMNKASGEAEQKKFVTDFIRGSAVILTIAAAVMAVFAKPLTRILVPGVSEANFPLAVNITYVMLPSLIFVVLAYIISGVLQNNRVFFITSVMSLPFNVILIAALFFPGVDIFTLSVVTTIGWFLHIVVQLPNFYRLGYRMFIGSGGLKLGLGGNKEVLLIFISNMMFQACFLLDKIAVSGSEGASTTITYASNLFVTIASVFVVAMSNVVFPSISQNYEEGKTDYVRKLIQYIILTMFAIFVPFILTVSCFGENVIALVYERGEFTPDLTARTAMLFTIYTLGVLGYLAQELFNKVLYLDAKYKYTVIGTIAVVAMKLIYNVTLGMRLGVEAVVTATTVLFTIYAVNVALAMKKTIGNYLDKVQLIRLGKVLLSGALALAAYFIMKLAAPGITAVKPAIFDAAIANKLVFLGPLLVCGTVYAIAMLALGVVKDILARPEAGKSQKEN
ncbi:MAG: hypothetical protein J1F63_06655 [Oscillospiraceae bacterium]|nr:hypothetical protein [Oscillospiraceae bacterium]